MIARKYVLIGFNPEGSGVIHTEKDAILFLAKDMAVPKMLWAYLQECKDIGCDDNHLLSIKILIDRVEQYQTINGCKVPDKHHW